MGLIHGSRATARGEARPDGFSLTVLSHGVSLSKDPEFGVGMGMSETQAFLAGSPAPVRICSAPTGSGKSYAFLKLAAVSRSQVLFVVPTRRLAQNLSASARRFFAEAAERDERLSGIWPSGVPESVLEWCSPCVTGDSGPKDRARRVAIFHGEDVGVAGLGRVVFTTPESLLSSCRPSFKRGMVDKGVLSILLSFDHVVFDEVHATASEGAGLPFVFAGARARCAGIGLKRPAKVTLLSATLPETEGFEKAFLPEGAPAGTVERMQERVSSDGDRILHGDVSLTFESARSVSGMALARADEIRAEIEAGRQVVLIFDRLRDLKSNHEELASLYELSGLSPKDVLLVTGPDDRVAGDRARGYSGETVGGSEQMENFGLVVGTSSLEAGVTFRDNRLLFMDAGFGVRSFLQRFGRCARGDCSGKVFVRLAPPSERPDHIARLEILAREKVSPSRLYEVLGKSRDGVFEFGSAGANSLGRSCAWAAVFTMSGDSRLPAHKPAEESLPPLGREILRHLRSLESIAGAAGLSSDERKSVSTWTEAWVEGVSSLRDFSETVTVIEGDGARRPYSMDFLLGAAAGVFDSAVVSEVGEEPVLDIRPMRLEDYMGVGILAQDRVLLWPFSSAPVSVEPRRGESSCVPAFLRLMERERKSLSSARRSAVESILFLCGASGFAPAA